MPCLMLCERSESKTYYVVMSSNAEYQLGKNRYLLWNVLPYSHTHVWNPTEGDTRLPETDLWWKVGTETCGRLCVYCQTRLLTINNLLTRGSGICCKPGILPIPAALNGPEPSPYPPTPPPQHPPTSLPLSLRLHTPAKWQSFQLGEVGHCMEEEQKRSLHYI